MFLYVTVSTLNPTVGIVVTDWPSLSLYNTARDIVKEMRYWYLYKTIDRLAYKKFEF